MIAPVDWSQIQQAISTKGGWTELGVIAVCLGVAWLCDQRVWRAREANEGHRRLSGSFARVVFPLTAFVLLEAAHALMRRSGPTFFVDVALPLLLALVAVRVIVYALRRLFQHATWLKTSERTVVFAFWALLILHYTGALPEIANEFDSIDIPVGKTGVSLLTFFKGALVVVGTLSVTLWLSSFFEQRVMRARFDVNLRVVLVKLMRAVLLTGGVLVALQWVGFDLRLLSVFGGALGVGIGLGLQKLASNYVSGFAILFDHSIRMGDIVTVSGVNGVVTRMTARYVVVRALDGTESIVPNEMLVTNIVLRHPPAAEVRIALQVQVARDADIDRALALMAQAAAADPRVRHDANPPQALLRGFGDFGITLELGIWLDNANVVRTDGDPVRSAVNHAILAAFRDNGIELASPPVPMAPTAG